MKTQKCERCNGNGRLPIPEEMRRLRKKGKVTLRQVAGLMGVSLTYVSDLERGKRNWSQALGEAYQSAIEGCS